LIYKITYLLIQLKILLLLVNHISQLLYLLLQLHTMLFAYLFILFQLISQLFTHFKIFFKCILLLFCRYLQCWKIKGVVCDRIVFVLNSADICAKHASVW